MKSQVHGLDDEREARVKASHLARGVVPKKKGIAVHHSALAAGRVVRKIDDSAVPDSFGLQVDIRHVNSGIWKVEAEGEWCCTWYFYNKKDDDVEEQREGALCSWFGGSHLIGDRCLQIVSLHLAWKEKED